MVGIKSLLSYEGDFVQELEPDFQNVTDEYLADCKERNVDTEQPSREKVHLQMLLSVLECRID